MSNSKPKGGARPGAGRKPRAIPRTPISIKVEPETARKFKAMCEAANLSHSEKFTSMVDGQ